jgi:hypothetical protein
MHVILGAAVLDAAQGQREFKPSAHLAGCTSVPSIFISLRGLVMMPLKYFAYRPGQRCSRWSQGVGPDHSSSAMVTFTSPHPDSSRTQRQQKSRENV